MEAPRFFAPPNLLGPHSPRLDIRRAYTNRDARRATLLHLDRRGLLDLDLEVPLHDAVPEPPPVLFPAWCASNRRRERPAPDDNPVSAEAPVRHELTRVRRQVGEGKVRRRDLNLELHL